MPKYQEPITLAHLQPKNRIIRSATHSFLPDEQGYMTEAEYSMYEKLAECGVGTIISGHCCVRQGGRANPEQVNIWGDGFADQFTRAADICHAGGALFLPQLSHAGPRAIDTEDLADVSQRDLKKGRHARELTPEEIKAIEGSFIAAAQRLQKAGVDGVQLHGAHSYLLSRFLDPTFNQRTDSYGNSEENRFRILEEIITGIRAACGGDFPIALKINIDSKYEDPELYARSLRFYLTRCQALGLEFVELSGVDFINQPKDATLYYLEQAAALKKEFPRLPLALVGGVRSLQDIEKALAEGLDLVSLSRGLIADPDLLIKLQIGGEKSRCVSCSRCFVLPHLHPGIRCVWAWKEVKARQKQQDRKGENS